MVGVVGEVGVVVVVVVSVMVVAAGPSHSQPGVATDRRCWEAACQQVIWMVRQAVPGQATGP